MKRCYRTSIATVQWLWTSLILCSILQQQQLAECACNLKYQTWGGFDYYVQSIPSTVTTVHDVNGIPCVLDHSTYDYQYKWKNSSICKGSCDDQRAYFEPVGPGGVTCGTLHSQLKISPYDLCKVGTTVSAQKSARVYRRTIGDTSYWSWAKTCNNADFSITVSDAASCACTDSLDDLSLSGAKEFVQDYASDTGTQIYITDGQ